MQKPLEYSIFPWTDCFQQDGFILSIRQPYTGERGQGFYLKKEDAVRAYHLALHRYNSGQNVCEYTDAPYAPEPTW